MPAPRYAWIQDAEVARAIDKSNTIRREHLRDQLFPFIQKIHQHKWPTRRRSFPCHISLEIAWGSGSVVGSRQLGIPMHSNKSERSNAQYCCEKDMGLSLCPIWQRDPWTHNYQGRKTTSPIRKNDGSTSCVDSRCRSGQGGWRKQHNSACAFARPINSFHSENSST